MLRFALFSILIAAAADAGPCAFSGLVATPLTSPDAVIEDGGGILMTLTPGPFDPNGSGDVLRPPSWRFRDDRGLTAPAIETLAPGLVIYRLPAGDGPVALVDGKRELAHVQRSTDHAAVLPAPMPTSIGHTSFEGFRGSRSESVIVHLIAPAPRGAIAIIAYGADGAARSWNRVEPGVRDVIVYSAGGRCQTPRGDIDSNVGDRVTVAWLDASGRLSARSAAVEVVAHKA